MDDLESWRSIRRTPGPNFELLDARIASALNKIIQNAPAQEKGQSGGNESSQRRPFPLRKPNNELPIFPGHWGKDNDSVENYADQFTVVLRNDDIQEFDSKWGEILLSMTQISSDDTLESLCELRVRESGELKAVLGLCGVGIRPF